MREEIPKVSVIIPIYNAQRYLPQCLDSLLDQTLEEVEFLCVDDASTDSSPEIIAHYAAADRRFRLLKLSEHSGVAAARNYGFSQARGDYVIFLDADDFFDDELLRKTWTRAQETDADMVLFQARTYSEDTHQFSTAVYYLRLKWLKNYEVFSRKDFPDRILTVTNPAVWDKLYRREFLLEQQLCFPPLPIAEDLYFTLLSLCLAERISYIPDTLISYRTDLSDTPARREGEAGNTCFLSALTLLYDELQRRGIYPEVEQSYVDTAVMSCVYNLDHISSFPARMAVLREMQKSFFPHTGILNYPPEKLRNREALVRLQATPMILDLGEKLFAGVPEAVWPREASTGEPTPLISIIIPIYNVEKYLAECLDSVIAQTLQEIEILCIDDGSADGSLYIAEEYAVKDPRIQIYTQDHQGVAIARNLGLSKAVGEYILFVDSDDCLEPDAARALYTLARAKKLDILLFDCDVFSDGESGLEEITEEETEYFHRSHSYPEVYPGGELMYRMRSNRDYNCSLCLQLIRRRHLVKNRLWFIPGIVHEDEPFTFQSWLTAKRIAYCDTVYYHRRIHPNSIMTSSYNYLHSIGCWKAAVNMRDLLDHADLPREQKRVLSKLVDYTMKKSREAFESLSELERCAYFGLSDAERRQFEEDVAVYPQQTGEKERLRRENVRYRKQLKQTTDQLIRTKRQRDALRRSHSYKLGRALTFVPRKLRGGIRCYREHGLRYTWQRLLDKSRKKLAGGKKQ